MTLLTCRDARLVSAITEPPALIGQCQIPSESKKSHPGEIVDDRANMSLHFQLPRRAAWLGRCGHLQQAGLPTMGPRSRLMPESVAYSDFLRGSYILLEFNILRKMTMNDPSRTVHESQVPYRSIRKLMKEKLFIQISMMRLCLRLQLINRGCVRCGRWPKRETASEGGG